MVCFVKVTHKNYGMNGTYVEQEGLDPDSNLPYFCCNVEVLPDVLPGYRVNKDKTVLHKIRALILFKTFFFPFC